MGHKGAPVQPKINEEKKSIKVLKEGKKKESVNDGLQANVIPFYVSV